MVSIDEVFDLYALCIKKVILNLFNTSDFVRNVGLELNEHHAQGFVSINFQRLWFTGTTYKASISPLSTINLDFRPKCRARIELSSCTDIFDDFRTEFCSNSSHLVCWVITTGYMRMYK